MYSREQTVGYVLLGSESEETVETVCMMRCYDDDDDDDEKSEEMSMSQNTIIHTNVSDSMRCMSLVERHVSVRPGTHCGKGTTNNKSSLKRKVSFFSVVENPSFHEKHCSAHKKIRLQCVHL